MKSMLIYVLTVCLLTLPSSAFTVQSSQNSGLDLVQRLGHGEFNNLVYVPEDGVAYIASASGLLLWDREEPDTLTDLLEVAEGGVSYVTFLNSSNQVLVLGLRNGSILTYSVENRQTTQLTSVGQFIRSISVSYDEAFLAIDSENGNVLLFNQLTKELTTLPDSLRSPSMFSPTEPLLIASNDSGLIVWDYQRDSQSNIPLPNLNELIMRIAFSHDGRQFAVSIRDGTIHVGKPGSAELVHTFSPFGCCVDSLHFDSSGKHIIAPYFYEGLVSWSLETLQMDFTLPAIYLADFAVIPDTLDVIALSFDGNLNYWPEGSDEPSAEIINTIGVSNQLEPIGDEIISVSNEFAVDEIILRSLDQPEQSDRFQLPDYKMLISLSIAPDNTELAYYAEPDDRPRNTAYIRRVDLSSKMLIEQYTLALDSVYDLQYDTSSDRIAIAGRFLNREGISEGQIVLVPDDQSKHSVLYYDGMIDALSVDWLEGNDKLVSTHLNGAITLWDVVSQMPEQFAKIPSMPIAQAVSENGEVLAVITYNNTLHLFNLDDLSPLVEISIDSELFKVGVSAEYRMVVTGSRDGSLRSYSFDGTLVFDLKAHSGQIEAIVFRGSNIVTSSFDYTTKVWQIHDS